ncbi:MAG: hypothetical protein KatS3mg054_0966 [Chloroflexus sp.]|nr:MAG: hypothetical protein KatS3mg054_0966 [Chloroflexus sp.]
MSGKQEMLMQRGGASGECVPWVKNCCTALVGTHGCAPLLYTLTGPALVTIYQRLRSDMHRSSIMPVLKCYQHVTARTVLACQWRGSAGTVLWL